MNQHYQRLEYDAILERLSEHAASEAARAKCLALTPAQGQGEAMRRMDGTTEARRIIDACGSPPVSLMTGLSAVLSLVELEGLLSPEEIAHVSLFLASCRRMKSYLLRAETTGAAIASYGGSLHDLSRLESEIDRCIRNGAVDDRASAQLYSLRRKIAGGEDEIKSKLSALLRRNREWFSESFVALRGGRHTLPVKREHKAKVPGTLVDVSSSGGTCFIEPASVGVLQQALGTLRVEEDAEVRRILYALGAEIHEELPRIRINIDAMETLDFLFAKGKLSMEMKASPVRVTEDAEIRILAGRHPMLDAETAVPLDFAIGGGVSGIVITGPNTGGKTVALKTVGLLSLMAQSGLHVPADERSSFCWLEGVLCDIGDGQSITSNLSTFSSHLKNILDILARMTPRSLILLDEIGSGTDPAEGMGIAVAILDALREGGCLFVATTHYPEIKEYAAYAEGLMNARMAFDRESLMPLYRLEIGSAGESCALHIAGRLGMPQKMLRRAEQAAYGAGRSPMPKQAKSGEETLMAVTPKAFPVQENKETAEKPIPHSQRFSVGDSVTVYPRREVGIVYARANERGEVGVQVKGQKRLVGHKRLKLLVAAEALYPADYDLSIVLDTVANRKARHLMGKRHEAGNVVVIREED